MRASGSQRSGSESLSLLTLAAMAREVQGWDSPPQPAARRGKRARASNTTADAFVGQLTSPAPVVEHRVTNQRTVLTFLRDEVWQGEVTDSVRLHAFLQAFLSREVRFRWGLGQQPSQLPWPKPEVLFPCMSRRLAECDQADLTPREQELYRVYFTAVAVKRLANKGAVPTPPSRVSKRQAMASPIVRPVRHRRLALTTIIPPHVDVPPIPYDPAAPTLADFLRKEVYVGVSEDDGRLSVLASGLTGMFLSLCLPVCCGVCVSACLTQTPVVEEQVSRGTCGCVRG